MAVAVVAAAVDNDIAMATFSRSCLTCAGEGGNTPNRPFVKNRGAQADSGMGVLGAKADIPLEACFGIGVEKSPALLSLIKLPLPPGMSTFVG